MISIKNIGYNIISNIIFFFFCDIVHTNDKYKITNKSNDFQPLIFMYMKIINKIYKYSTSNNIFNLYI